MNELPGLLTLPGLVLWLIWNFAVLASIQLTVRLIRAFSVLVTLRGAIALTAGTVPVIALYVYVLQRQVGMYWLAMLLTGVVGYVVARFVLRIKRQRGRVVAAAGTALLSGPWPVFFDVLIPTGVR